MILHKAIWGPYWYELDQTIEVGVATEYYFFRTPPDYIASDGLPVFFHGLWTDDDSGVAAETVVNSIEHVQFGSLVKIDTSGLDYTLTLSDGKQQLVEAEESPGLVYGWPDEITDWRFFVDLQPVELPNE